MATKVRILTKPMSGGRESVYLDFHPPIKHPKTGKPTRREFLKLFLHSTKQTEEQIYTDANGKQQKRIVAVLDSKYKPKKVVLSQLQKMHNRDTLEIATNVQAQRQISIQAGEFGFLAKEKLNMDFCTYFEQLARKRKGSNFDNWRSAIIIFKEYAKGEVKMSELTSGFCNEYKEHLLGLDRIKTNTKVAYFGKFKAALKQAYKESLLSEDISKNIDNIETEDTTREYVTHEELVTLYNTECEIPELKTAALFSAFTGLRHSDIVALCWGDIIKSDSGWVIKFTQQKTRKKEVLPISDEAFELLGERGVDDKLIFEAITHKYDAWYNERLKKWIVAAGINRKVTFHSFRHTYATLLLTQGVDIYTVSKMLGHRELKTTQIYAKVVDESKRKAANKITLK